MKITILPLIGLLGICFTSFGQNVGKVTSSNEKGAPAPQQAILSSQKNIEGKNFSDATNTADYYFQKSRAQKISGMVLITGGSVISFLGIRAGLDNSRENSINKNLFRSTGSQNATCSGLTLTGLVMMAGSIPYFIYSLKNKNKAGFKLSCQKTFFGASARACKKVNSLTFAIPIGR